MFLSPSKKVFPRVVVVVVVVVVVAVVFVDIFGGSDVVQDLPVGVNGFQLSARSYQMQQQQQQQQRMQLQQQRHIDTVTGPVLFQQGDKYVNNRQWFRLSNIPLRTSQKPATTVSTTKDSSIYNRFSLTESKPFILANMRISEKDNTFPRYELVSTSKDETKSSSSSNNNNKISNQQQQQKDDNNDDNNDTPKKTTNDMKTHSVSLPPVLQQIADERMEFRINLGRAMDTLRRDASDILQRTPDFSIFHEDIQAMDPSGIQLTGLKNYKSAIAFFQTFVQFWFQTKSSTTSASCKVQYRMVYDFARSSIRISWSLVLVPKLFSPNIPFSLLSRPLYVDGISHYTLSSSSGKITHHKIERLLINNTPVIPPYGLWNILQQQQPEFWSNGNNNNNNNPNNDGRLGNNSPNKRPQTVPGGIFASFVSN